MFKFRQNRLTGNSPPRQIRTADARNGGTKVHPLVVLQYDFNLGNLVAVFALLYEVV